MGFGGTLGRSARGLVAALVVGTWALPAAALDFWDGRVEIHGFYENQIRSIWEDYSTDDWDLTQWYHVLNLEVEADLAPDGLGPIELLQGFSRIEVRYDCVWTRGCGLIRSADVYGNRAERLPDRLIDGRRSGFKGDQFVADTRPFHLQSNLFLGPANRDRGVDSRKAFPFWGVQGFRTLFDQDGPDGIRGTPENPGDDGVLFIFSSLLDDDCLYGTRKTRGSANGVGNQVLPHTPACKIRSVGALRDKPHPLSSLDRNFPVLGGSTGGLALPYRPAPEYRVLGQGPRAPAGEAQGLFVPNHRLAQLLREDEFDSFDQNFRQAELEWNRGASQQDEKELKELYLDIEAFEARLWVRVGKQNIVWGKTELFRTTDQFNPQDLALASLPSLEESRIALWAIRAVWSFWNVGPFNDVRMEFAANFDQFEPADLGRCGEPYTPLPVCDKTFGLQVHSLTGIGIAGEIRPPNPWNSWKGLEVGGRLEWRWNRFSFAISDFYGYNDQFYVDRLFQYSRNVDPLTGRPREGMRQGRCRTGNEEACLEPGETLARHSANQQVFAVICAGSVGFSPDLDPTACGQSVFNSQAIADPTNPFSPRVMIALNNILSGQSNNAVPFTGAFVLDNLGAFSANTRAQIAAQFAPGAGNTTLILGVGPGVATPLVPLTMDPNDGGPATLTAAQAVDPTFSLWTQNALQPFLTTQQEALLGCGPFYGTQCDIEGVDLLNAEASVLLQSWPSFDGSFGNYGVPVWDTTDRSLPQPGTVGFEGGPVATRYVDGELVILPGARGPGDKGYDIRVDGSTGGAVHPFTGQRWRSELSILSWNALMGLVALSSGDTSDFTVFDPDRPFAKGRCSFRNPSFCSSVTDFLDITSVGRPSVRAGGNGRFGRRDFTWTSGADVVLRYEKRNVLGFSMDFAEDVTKSNWSIESTWIEGLPFGNQDALDYATEADTYNLTVSVDRPTFINFLNSNRTFFMNAQFFIQYVDGYEEGFTSNGPWNFLMTFAVNTGYFQDRLLPGITFVYDFRSNSGAVLPQVEYRFTSNASAIFGVAAFYGRFEKRDLALHPVNPSGVRVGKHRGSTFVENGLSPIRERDEIFLRLRYTW